MSTLKLSFVFSLKAKDQCPGWFLLITYLCFCHLTLPGSLFRLRPVVPHGSVPLQFLAVHATYPCGALRSVPCLLQQRTLTQLYLIFWFDLVLGVDSRVFFLSS